jgi:hypothetical protein
MGERDDYLIGALRGTRFREEPDPVWAQVPSEERPGLLARENARWEQAKREGGVTPIVEKIHANWRGAAGGTMAAVAEVRARGFPAKCAAGETRSNGCHFGGHASGFL